MNIAREAEDYIKQYFKDKKNIELIKPNKGEIGFDFKDKDSKIFIEVKGTSKSKLSDVLFRYFTNAEYEKAKECIRKKLIYEAHIVLGIGTNSIKHYRIPAKIFIDKAKPEVAWYLPTTKELEKFKLSYKRNI